MVGVSFIPSVSLLDSVIMVGIGTIVGIGYALYIHKKDEMQTMIIQKALSTAFVSVMATFLVQTILTYVSNLDFKLTPLLLVVFGLVVFLISLIINFMEFRVGKEKMKNQIKKIRKDFKMTQLELAKEIGVSRQTINAIENNKYNPTIDLAIKISKKFGVTIEELFLVDQNLD